MYNRVKCLVCILVSILLIASVTVSTQKIEDQTNLEEETVEKAETDLENGPTSVTSVSKFITEFHVSYFNLNKVVVRT